MVLVFVWPKTPPPRPPLFVAVLMLLLFLLPVILIPLADGFFVKPKETGFSFVELLVPPSFKVVVFEEGGEIRKHDDTLRGYLRIFHIKVIHKIGIG